MEHPSMSLLFVLGVDVLCELISQSFPLGLGTVSAGNSERHERLCRLRSESIIWALVGD